MARRSSAVQKALAALLLSPLLLGWSAPAAASPATGELAISPALNQLELGSSQPSVDYQLRLTNRSNVDQSFRLSVVDFGSLNESGGVAFLGTPANELDHPYGLASWMTLEKDAVFIPKGTTAQLTVTVNNRASLAPGGHYGAVLATAVDDQGDSAQKTANQHVGVRQVLSSLILLIKDGGANPELHAVSQDIDGNAWHLPSNVEVRFQNAGNIHLTPRGIIEIIAPNGAIIKRNAIDDGSGIILPESFRRYPTALLPVGRALLPGQYRVVTTYRYDGTTHTQTLITPFFYIGDAVVWLVISAALLALAYLIWWCFLRAPGEGNIPQRLRKLLVLH